MVRSVSIDDYVHPYSYTCVRTHVANKQERLSVDSTLPAPGYTLPLWLGLRGLAAHHPVRTVAVQRVRSLRITVAEARTLGDDLLAYVEHHLEAVERERKRTADATGYNATESIHTVSLARG